MKKLLAFIFLTSLVVYAGLPPTSLKGGNEASLQTTFQFDLGQIPVTRTGTNVVFGTIPVTQGGTSQTTLTQYGLLAGNGTAAVQTVSPGASGTILFSNGASAFPSYRLLASSDITTSLGYTPLASTTAAIVSTLGYTPLNRTNNLSDLVSSSTARTNLGLGTLATKSVIDLGSGDVTGTTSVVNGGTGVSSTVAQGVLVGSGTTSYRIASPASAGAVLMQSVSGTTAFLQPQPINVGNLLINGGFETYDSSTGSFYGWSSSSSGDIGNWTSPSQWDLKYWKHIDTTVTLGTDIFQTVTIPSSLYGQNCEFGFDYTNTNTSGTVTRSWYVSGTSTVSGTFSSSGTSSIKAFLPCGTASDTTKVVNITTTNASASGVTSVDNVYFGPAKSLVNGAIVGPTQTQQTITIGATTTAPTKGTIAQDKIEWNRDGEYIVATYRLHTTTAGTAGSGDYLISLPNGLSFDSGVSFSTSASVPAQEVNAKQYGFGTISDGTNNGYVFPVPYDSTRFKLGEVTNAARSMFNSASNINFSGAVGLSVTIRAKIQGWSGSGVTYESRCPNDISCANQFGAKVSSGNAVTDENLDWISSCTGTTSKACTFNTGVFTTAPICTIVASSGGDGINVGNVATSASSVSWSMAIPNVSVQNQDVQITCVRGIDYVAKKTITGYLSQNIKHNLSGFIPTMYGANINNTNGSSAVNNQSGSWISTSSCAGTGQCTYTIASGLFTSTSTYWCGPGGIASTGGTSPTIIKNSATSLSITTYNGTTPANMSTDIICFGY